MSTREAAARAAALPPVVRQFVPIKVEIVRDERYYGNRGRLVQERTKLNEQLKMLRENLKVSARDVHTADIDEIAQNEGLLGGAATEINFVSDQLTAVNAAFQALENGTYGKCETCTKEIAEKRLNAVPFAKQCIECA